MVLSVVNLQRDKAWHRRCVGFSHLQLLHVNGHLRVNRFFNRTLQEILSFQKWTQTVCERGLSLCPCFLELEMNPTGISLDSGHDLNTFPTLNSGK